MTIMDPLENEDRWIDRLVDGELSGDERRALLARLAAEPGGWRRCALAFLEAQAWREAFAPVASTAGPVPAATLTSPKVQRLAVARTAVALAASLLMAFSLGWLSRGQADSPAALVARNDPTPMPTTTTATTVNDPDTTEPETVAEQQGPPPPDPLVSRLESRGYQVDRRRGLVAVQTRDGRRMAVPVAEVRVKYVGDRTY
jgi:hypothetical protein